MNTEQFKQSWEQLGGHLQRHWSKMTDGDLLHIDDGPASMRCITRSGSPRLDRGSKSAPRKRPTVY
jgi:hypothetical protein